MSDISSYETDGSEYVQNESESSESSSDSYVDMFSNGDIGIENIKLCKRKRRNTHRKPLKKKRQKHVIPNTGTSAPNEGFLENGNDTYNSKRPLLFTSATSDASPAKTPQNRTRIVGEIGETTQSQKESSCNQFMRLTNYFFSQRFESRLIAIEKAMTKMEKKTSKKTRNETRPRKTPIKISSSVRGAIRDAHTSGKDSGLKWTVLKDDIRMRPQSEENRQMTDYISTFVKGIYPETSDAVIESSILQQLTTNKFPTNFSCAPISKQYVLLFVVATERYFQSIKEKEQRQKKGKTEQFNKKMMYYQRRKRKLTNRIDAVKKKTSWSQELKDKITSGLTMDFISSESEHESDGESVYVIKPIPWRSEELNGYIKELDKKIQQTKSKSAKRQSAKRIISDITSQRRRPNVEVTLNWALKSTETTTQELFFFKIIFKKLKYNH
ncbi:hypothetical protein KUTeg_013703 [Tegillarca granosa]|uniref:Uncharacterized protein n=1 Tax=Tegillarca granosa TaxID=220873 RepID=A0ABQ9EUG7_TEGGR|nr:hypothetical protein KUTeg_013703 [Tegillarca granosa]